MFKRLKKWMIASSFTILYVMLIAIYPTNESVVLPGNIQNTSQIFSIDGLQTTSMQTVYVISYEPLTYFQRSILELSRVADISNITPYEESLTQLEMFQVGQIQKESSYHQAVITAYEKANVEVLYSFLGFDLVSVPNEQANLKIGDRIIAVNDVTLEVDTSLNQFIRDQTLTIDLIRDEQLQTVTYERGEGDIPLYVFPMYQISKTTPNIDLKGLDSLIGGPSGGMMMTLSIYATLKNISIDETLAGTGTILSDGRIGRIGGLLQKYYTVYDRVDYFLVPKDQVLSLAHVDSKKVIAVETIDDAISFLESLI